MFSIKKQEHTTVLELPYKSTVFFIFKTQELSCELKRHTGLNPIWPTTENLVLDPLAVLLLNNRLFI